MNAPDLLAACFAPNFLPNEPHVFTNQVHCAITGSLIAQGHLVSEIVTSATANIADTFRVRSDYVSESVARLFKDSRFTGNILAIEGQLGIRPMVALSSATEERPAWTNLLKILATGTRTVAIVTSDTKRRLWPDAPLAIVGPSWRIFFHDGSVSRVLRLDYAKLVECLMLVESVYSLGFPKTLISSGLIAQSALKMIDAIGFERVEALEQQLTLFRHTDEMILSLFVAQKSAQKEDLPCQTISLSPRPLQPALFV